MVAVLKGTLVFRFGPRLGLKTGVYAQAEQLHIIRDQWLDDIDYTMGGGGLQLSKS